MNSHQDDTEAAAALADMHVRKDKGRYTISSEDEATADRALQWLQKMITRQDDYVTGVQRKGNTLTIVNPGTELRSHLARKFEQARQQHTR